GKRVKVRLTSRLNKYRYPVLCAYKIMHSQLCVLLIYKKVFNRLFNFITMLFCNFTRFFTGPFKCIALTYVILNRNIILFFIFIHAFLIIYFSVSINWFSIVIRFLHSITTSYNNN